MRTLFTLTLFLFSTSVSSDYLDCPCKVVKVVDGDTVHVLDERNKRYKIRLGGIDAPERKQPFGRRSTRNLAQYIAGEMVEVEYATEDRYGRIIGKILKDGSDINLRQVIDGFAWHYKYYQRDQSPTDRNLYDQAETAAKESRIGLWAESAIPPWDFRRMN